MLLNKRSVKKAANTTQIKPLTVSHGPQVEGFWQTYKNLPTEQQEWDASKKLKTEIVQYMEVLPLLRQLHSREIRNRHWLQVMGVANCTFQLEGTVFKMAHLLDASLLQ